LACTSPPLSNTRVTDTAHVNCPHGKGVGAGNAEPGAKGRSYSRCNRGAVVVDSIAMTKAATINTYTTTATAAPTPCSSRS